MQKKQTNILFVSLLLFLTFSCSVSKKNIVKNFSDDEKENVFIYLFDEAGKNRLNGNLQKAEEQYLASLEVNPQSAASYFYLASIYIARKDYQSALNFSKKAVEINPENYWYLLEKADLLKINGKENDAEIIYKKLLNKNPKNESVYDKLSEIYSKNNDIKKLIGLYELKSRKYDDSPETLLTLFNLYLKDKNYKKAEQIITSAEKKYPDDFKIKGTAAEFFYSTGKKEKAEKIYKKLLSEYPDNTDINLSYAFFCKKTGKEDEYFEITKKLMSSDLDVYKKINLLTSGRYNNF
ncbi:MAG: tetratricopeptide repeat protein, partial [Chlorobi bacterium]|nr:tetratricopeptide repeat protein [Chlorobiota bacterium]